MKSHDILASLTPSQRQAASHVDGPLLILAGPGSGKTRVVTHRIAFLLQQGISARSILALTFTNKAADEMQRRLGQLAPGEPVWMGTFHRFCARLLRTHAPLVGLSENFTIYDAEDSLKVLRRVVSDSPVELHHYTPETIARAIGHAKNLLMTAETYAPRRGDPLGKLVAEMYPAYQARLLRSNAVDFDDLLLHAAMLLKDNPEVRASLDERHRYILVDEYQDTNLAQYTIVRALSIDEPNLAVTGDPDQSIYGWRGANLNNILEFEKDYPSVVVVRLEQNYRSTPNILRAADQLISHNVRRKPKDLFTENPPGRPIRLVRYSSGQDEGEGIASVIAAEMAAGRRRPADFAVFYRVNSLSRTVEDALRHHGIPYQIVNGVEFFQRQEVKDVIGYLKLLANPSDDEALLRVVNTPPRGIGKSTLDRLRRYAADHRLTLLEAARQSGVVPGVSKRSAVAVARFVALFDRLGEAATGSLEEILGLVLSLSEYEQQYSGSEDEADQQRLANVHELLTVAREFDAANPGTGHLEAFLEQVALVNDTDAFEDATDKVTLMTLHSAKGLEFPVVFIVALEQGLLPHDRSKNNPDEVEEERRLLFVGITRAERDLQLSLAQYRDIHGQRRHSIPSFFLQELPLNEMQLAGFEESRTLSAAPADDEFFPDDHADELPAVAVSEAPDKESPLVSTAGLRLAALTTAAELAGARSEPSAAVSPEVFSHGMVVQHPEYGLGKIIALSGEGRYRNATVQFFTTAGAKKMVLAHSRLVPVRSQEE